MSNDDLGFWQSIYQNMDDAAKDGWNSVTWENVQWAGGLLACFGWGFYTGYNYDRMLFPVDFVPNQTENRVAQGVGWLGGVICREAKKWNERKNNRDRQR